MIVSWFSLVFEGLNLGVFSNCTLYAGFYLVFDSQFVDQFLGDGLPTVVS